MIQTNDSEGYTSFSSFLLEDKNLHLTHLEDAIFDKGKEGAQEIIKFLIGLEKLFSGHSKSKHNITTKFDGAPAIFAGVNPENGKFFVGTKSVFNKNPKLNYTIADIKKNHHGGLQEKLTTALTELPKLGIKGIIQGDILFTKSDLKIETIDDEKYITFAPNTITYAVPANSKMAKTIKTAKLGVVFHTEYSGASMSNMKASFGLKQRLKNTSAVWTVDAQFKDVSGVATFTATESKQLKRFIDFLDKQSKKLKVNTDWSPWFNQFYNQLVRSGKIKSDGKAKFIMFRQFLSDKFDKDIDKMKSEKGKTAKQQVKDETLKAVDREKANIEHMFDLHWIVADVKRHFVNKMNKVESLKHFIKTNDGYRVTAPEGFVAIDHIGTNALKLVDRLEFSRTNFTAERNWK